MSVTIPVGTMHVIQPMLHALENESVSVTYAVRHTFNPILDAEAQTLINALQGAWNGAGSMRSMLDTEVQVLPPTGYYTQSVGAPLKAAIAVGAAQPGLVAQLSPSSNVSAVITKRTAFVGRAFRGRMFLPWSTPESAIDEVGRITPAEVTTRQGFVNTWVTAVNAVAGVDELVLLHDSLSPQANTSHAIVSWTFTPVIGTQRRRLRR